jgi:hypothetical protein
MSFEDWSKAILNRFPREQFAQNVMMVLDMANIITRHQVNAATQVALHLSPDSIEELGDIDTDLMDKILKVSLFATSHFSPSNTSIRQICLTKKHSPLTDSYRCHSLADSAWCVPRS